MIEETCQLTLRQTGNSNPVPTGSTECIEGCGLKIARSSKAESQVGRFQRERDRCMESVGSRGAVQAQNTRVKNVAVCASTHTIHLKRRYPDSRRRTCILQVTKHSASSTYIHHKVSRAPYCFQTNTTTFLPATEISP